MPRVCLTFATASIMIDRVFRPRKSILIMPVSSITLPSYCVTSTLEPSESVAVDTGTQSVMSSRPIITPHACTPVLRTFPSSCWAKSITSRTSGLGLSASAANSLTNLRQFLKLTLPSGILSGTRRARRLASGNGSSMTFATSFMAILVAMVPYVIICATFSAPYFSVTYLSTV